MLQNIKLEIRTIQDLQQKLQLRAYVPAKVEKDAVFQVDSRPTFARFEKSFEMSVNEPLCI